MWVLIDDRNITSFPYPFLHPKDMSSWEVFLSTNMFLLNDVPEVDVQLHDRTMTTPVDYWSVVGLGPGGLGF